MPAVTVTPEPVTNSGRGWGEEWRRAREEWRRDGGSGGEHLMAQLCLRPLTQPLLTAAWNSGWRTRCGGLLKCSEAPPPPLLLSASFLTSKMLLKYTTLGA